MLPGDPAAMQSEHDRASLIGCDAAQPSTSNESTSNENAITEIQHLSWLEGPIAPSLAPRPQALNQPFAGSVFGLEVTNRFAWCRHVDSLDFGVAYRRHRLIFPPAQCVKTVATRRRENCSTQTRADRQMENHRPDSGSQSWEPHKHSFFQATALEVSSLYWNNSIRCDVLSRHRPQYRASSALAVLAQTDGERWLTDRRLYRTV